MFYYMLTNLMLLVIVVFLYLPTLDGICFYNISRTISNNVILAVSFSLVLGLFLFSTSSHAHSMAALGFISSLFLILGSIILCDFVLFISMSVTNSILIYQAVEIAYHFALIFSWNTDKFIQDSYNFNKYPINFSLFTNVFCILISILMINVLIHPNYITTSCLNNRPLQQLNMLINKLIQKLAFPQARYNPIYLFAAEKKAQKAKPAGKQAGKDAPKGDNQKGSAAGNEKSGQKNPDQSKGEGQKKEAQVEISKSFLLKTDAANMYRKVIRGLTIKKKTERANFNEQSLVHIINIATRKDINLMYEAYYNYLGHYTPISNKTVDSLICKTASLGQKKQDAAIAEEASSKMFQVLQNHEYLGYFPHYQTTLKAAQFSAKINKLPLFLETLKNKPLIKLDAATIKGLFELTTQWKDFIRLAKILAYRANKQILVGVTNEQLLKTIIEGVKKFEKLDVTGFSNSLYKFLSQFETTHPDVALVYVLMHNGGEKAQAVLNAVEKDSANIKDVVNTVNKIKEQKLEKVKQMVEKALEGTAHKDLFK